MTRSSQSGDAADTDLTAHAFVDRAASPNDHNTALIAAVLESTRVVSSSLDLDEVLNLILRVTCELSGAHSVSVMLLDDTCSYLVISAAVGVPEEVRCGLRLPVGSGLAGWVAQTGQMLHLSNAAADPRFIPYGTGDIANLLAMPLRVHDHVLGVLNLSQHAVYELFSDTIVQMVEIFASHAAIAIANAHTTADLRRAAARDHLLNQINQMMRVMQSTVTVIDFILQGLGQTLNLAHCLFYRTIRPLDTLPTAYTQGWHAPGAATSDLAGYAGIPLVPVQQYSSALLPVMTPITYHGRCVGWLLACPHEFPHHFRDDELNLIRAVADQLALVIAQDELTTQEQRSRDLSATLSQFAAACNMLLSLDSLLNFILEQLARFIDYDAAGIWLYREADYDILVAARGHEINVLNYILYVGPGSLNGRVTQQRCAVVVPDVLEEPGWQGQVPCSTAIRSWIGVPLLVNDQRIGMLTIDKMVPNAFTADDALIAQTFADHVAVAIRDAQLYQQTQVRANQLQVLHQLSIQLGAMHEVDPLLNTLATLLHKSFGYYQVIVALLEGDLLVLKAAQGQVRQIEHLSTMRQIPLYVGLPGWAARHGETVLVNNVITDPRYVLHPELLATRAELAVPIKGTGRILGVIDVQSDRMGVFEQNDVYLIEALAGQTAVAIENIARYDELRRTQEQLFRSERLRALGELASGIAHDFNNLLASILGHTQLLLLNESDPSLIEELQIIERAAMDGAAAVRRMQDFAQMHRVASDELVDMNQVVEESLAITRPRWRDTAQIKDQPIDVVRDLYPLPWIMGDGPALREVITNLILNALDAMPYGGRLHIRSSVQSAAEARALQRAPLVSTDELQDAQIVIEVSDTGVGIPDTIQQRIFDPFFTTKGTQGTGMGLAMAHSIVQRHMGTITVQSTMGKGSTFVISLPVKMPDTASSGPSLALPQNTASGLRILVVEDEVAVQRVLVQMMSRWGHSVKASSSGVEALALFAPGTFDLVCSDLGMPGVSGWSVLNSVRKADPQVATLLITGWGEQIALDEARARGADYILVKPFDGAALRQAISTAWEWRQEVVQRDESNSTLRREW